jgi:hypothetical protein
VAGVGSKGLGGDHVGGHGHLGATGSHGVDHGLGIGHQVGLGQALADLQAGSQHEGVGNAAAHDELVHLVGQALEDGQLGGHLGAGHDGGQRTAARQGLVQASISADSSGPAQAMGAYSAMP